MPRTPHKGGRHKPASPEQRAAVEAALAPLLTLPLRPSEAAIAEAIGISASTLKNRKLRQCKPETLASLLASLAALAEEWKKVSLARLPD